jgi:hypothetical protein
MFRFHLFEFDLLRRSEQSRNLRVGLFQAPHDPLHCFAMNQLHIGAGLFHERLNLRDLRAR